MKVIHGEFEKLFPASDSLDGLLKSINHVLESGEYIKENCLLKSLQFDHNECFNRYIQNNCFNQCLTFSLKHLLDV